MDGELVTDSPSRGGGQKPPPFRYGAFFEEQCPYYMAMGMTYDEYWDGDSLKCKFYREAEEIRTERENYHMWLQGAYLYEAMLDVAPAFNAFSKGKPKPYRNKPIAITRRQQIAEENQKKLEASAEAASRLMARFQKG